MAITLAVAQRRLRVVDEELMQSGYVCTPMTGEGQSTCMRVLWEDDRVGRISEVLELPARQHQVLIEVPAGRSAAGQVYWKPLEHLAGAQSEAAQALVRMLRELAGDLFAHTASLREVDALDPEELPPYRGLV